MKEIDCVPVSVCIFCRKFEVVACKVRVQLLVRVKKFFSCGDASGAVRIKTRRFGLRFETVDFYNKLFKKSFVCVKRERSKV